MTTRDTRATFQNWNFQNLIVLGKAATLVLKEVAKGFLHRTIHPACFAIGMLMCAVLATRLDTLAWKKSGMAWLYPINSWIYWPYAGVVIGTGFWIWGLARVVARRKLIKQLTEAFRNAGLKTALGRVPGFVSDEPIDEFSRRLTLVPVGLPLADFQKAKPKLESSLRIFIDDIRENLTRGIITIHYAHAPMGAFEELGDDIRRLAPNTFRIGKTRAGWIETTLPEVPHYLIAGQTNSGKSTFLRQMITTLYLNNPKMEFLLIDLKGGLEFQLFDSLRRVRVFASASQALIALKEANDELDHRITLLHEKKAKDILAYNELKDGPRLHRKVIVVDEATELFLSGDMTPVNESQDARRYASRIAAQGRAVGIHLIIATQRPDRKAVASHTKTNLQGRLCFQMADNASSMTILDSVRATDLPPIPGRAIWKNGLNMTEVQTAFLSSSEAEELLAPNRLPPQAPTVVVPEQKNTESGAIPEPEPKTSRLPARRA